MPEPVVRTTAAPQPSSESVASASQPAARFTNALVITNVFAGELLVSVVGIGSVHLDPGEGAILRARPFVYRLQFGLAGGGSVSLSRPGFPGGLWRIAKSIEDSKYPDVFVEAQQNPATHPALGQATVPVQVVNDHDQATSLQIGYTGPYFRLRPGESRVLRLSPLNHVACLWIGSDQQHYQVCTASSNAVWRIRPDSAARSEPRLRIEEGVAVGDLVSPENPVGGARQKSALGFGALAATLPVGQIFQVQAHRDRTTAVAFSPDGTVILSGGDDKSVCFWERQAGSVVCRSKHDAPGSVEQLHSLAAAVRSGRSGTRRICCNSGTCAPVQRSVDFARARCSPAASRWCATVPLRSSVARTVSRSCGTCKTEVSVGSLPTTAIPGIRIEPVTFRVWRCPPTRASHSVGTTRDDFGCGTRQQGGE